MLRRNDVTVLIRPNQSWPVWSSLLLHGTLMLLCCAIPHGPKVHDCIMVDLRMPNLGIPGPMGGHPVPAPSGPRSGGAPAAKAPRPAPPAVPTAPACPEPREQTLPTTPPATAVARQKAGVAQSPVPSSISRGMESAAAGKGQAGSAPAQGGGGGSGVLQGNGTSSGSGGSGTGGSGGSGKPFEGEFGAQGSPTYLHKKLPVYPRFAQRIGKEGAVLLRLTLDDRGVLAKVEVMKKAGYGFDEAAVAAVHASSFRPALRNGRPVPCRALLPITFNLQDQE